MPEQVSWTSGGLTTTGTMDPYGIQAKQKQQQAQAPQAAAQPQAPAPVAQPQAPVTQPQQQQGQQQDQQRQSRMHRQQDWRSQQPQQQPQYGSARPGHTGFGEAPGWSSHMDQAFAPEHAEGQASPQQPDSGWWNNAQGATTGLAGSPPVQNAQQAAAITARQMQGMSGQPQPIPASQPFQGEAPEPEQSAGGIGELQSSAGGAPVIPEGPASQPQGEINSDPYGQRPYDDGSQNRGASYGQRHQMRRMQPRPRFYGA